MAMGGMLEELAAAAEQSRARQLAGRQKALQDEVDLEREQLEIAEALAAQREKAYTQQEEALDLQRERTEAEKDAVEAAAAYALEQREIAYATAEAVAGTFGTLAGIMGQVIQQQEAAGESVEVLKAIEGGFLIAYNAVMAATEIAKAIGSYPDVAGILAHSAAAAAHVSAAVMAAAQLGGGSAAGASASAAARPAAFAPAEQPRPSGRGSDQGVTIHQQYLLSDSESGLARSLERATWQRRRQYRAARSDAVRYGA